MFRGDVVPHHDLPGTAGVKALEHVPRLRRGENLFPAFVVPPRCLRVKGPRRKAE